MRVFTIAYSSGASGSRDQLKQIAEASGGLLLRGQDGEHRVRLPLHLQLLLVPAPAPYDRARYNRALIANALLDPFNVVLLAVVLIVGILLGIFAYALPIGAVLVPRGGGADVLRRGRREQGARAREGLASQAGRGGAGEGQARGLRAADRAAAARGADARAADRRRDRARRPALRGGLRGGRPLRGGDGLDRRGARSCSTRRWPTRRPTASRRGWRRCGGDGGQAGARGGADDAAHDAAADGEAARQLLRRDGADPRRAGHGALAARVGVRVVESRACRRSLPPTCARCASGWARGRGDGGRLRGRRPR